jgi:acyl dehydratase
VNHSRDTLLEAIGRDVAVSGWTEVSQDRIDRFADVTDDHQWIHSDVARASQSPFGSTIAQGFLTLSLLAPLIGEAVAIEGTEFAINYGLNRVRFVAPLPAGSRIRARLAPLAVADTRDGIRVTWKATIEREGSARPICVAEWIVQYRLAARPASA